MAAPGGISQSPAQGVYRSIISSQYHLYESLDARFQMLAKKVLAIAVEIAGDWVSECQLANREIAPEAALEQIGNRLARYQIAFADIHRVDELEGKLVALTVQFQSMNGELNRVRSERDQFAKELQEIKRVRENKKGKVAAPEQTPEPAWNKSTTRPPATPALPVAQPLESKPSIAAPDWYREWEAASQRANRFDWDTVILQVIGETGMSERQAIAEEARARQGVSEYNKRPLDSLNRLAEDGLLAVRDAASGPGGGRPPRLYQLTEKGQAAYVFLTSNRPQASELATKTIHKSDAHTLLNARTVRILQSAGYEICAQGERIELTGGHLFQPDITAVHTVSRELIYVEVEMDARKGDWQAREQKWQNCWAATGGAIYLVTENRKSERRLLSEIRASLPRKSYQIRAFNFEDGPASDDIWVCK